MGLREIQELMDTTPEELGDGLMEMNASRPMPDGEREDIEVTVPQK